MTCIPQRNAKTRDTSMLESMYIRALTNASLRMLMVGTMLLLIPLTLFSFPWEIWPLDENGDVGKYNSFAVLECACNVSYYDSTSGDLKYARWMYPKSGKQIIQVVDSVGDIGKYTSICLGSSIWHPGISYYDATNGDLKYAHSHMDSSVRKWKICKVDTAGDVGRFTSIDADSLHHFDSLGCPHISYYDATNGDLKYAYSNGIQWEIEKVDTAGDVGQYSSLDLDSLAHAHISYYDATNGDLLYARWTGTHWEIQEVDTSGDVGKHCSLSLKEKLHRGLTRYFRPAISYYDATNGDLKHARWTGTEWHITRVDTSGDVGMFSSIVYIVPGHTWVAYYDAIRGNLKVAPGSHGSDTVTVDTTGDVGQYASYADCAWRRVVYYDATNRRLMYAVHYTETEEDVRQTKELELAPRSANPAGHEDIAFSYNIPEEGRVTLEVYDVTGNSICTLVDGPKNAGKHSAVWDAHSSPTGIYFCRLGMGKIVITRKVVVLQR